MARPARRLLSPLVVRLRGPRPSLLAGAVICAVLTCLASTATPAVAAGAATDAAGPAAITSAAQAADPVIGAAGDIACIPGSNPTSTSCQQAATGNALVAMNPTAVLPLGDNQYESGTLAEFQGSYDPTWGRLKNITRPIPGNHEYLTAGAAGYYSYFGAAAGDPAKGYYSFDVGAWHVIALNSECAQVGGCGAGSPQETWLRNDLAAHSNMCTLAYWHRPRFSSGTTVGSSTTFRPFWQALYNANADLVLAGHAHHYERFAPQNPDGTPDTVRGIRQFIVGTGGRNFQGLAAALPTTEVRNNNTFGVLKLSLHPTGYDWEFVRAAGGSFTDSGSDTCHGGGDTTPPSAPTNLSASAPSSTQVNLSWTASTDNVGVTGYRVYRNGAFLANTGTTTSFSDTTVAAGTTYSYQVSAVDAAANESAKSNSASVTTPPSPGTLTFGPTDDAYVEQAAPSSNFGAATRLVADNSPVDHFLVRFDVALTGCSTITAASLRLTVGSGSTDNSPSGGNFFTTGTGWNEATVTWNSAPPAGTQVGSLGAVAVNTTYSVDVTRAVTGPGPVAFRVSSPSSDGVRYFSKQGSTTQAPKLVITCS
jgi:acid phosphatase type 7